MSAESARALTERLSRTLGIPTATALRARTQPRPVDPALAGLFARGGLPRGEIVSCAGPHVLSVALACCGAVTAEGGWCAGIGLGEGSTSALAGLGVRLSRFVGVDTPAQDWLRVVSILLESFAVLVAAPGFSPAPSDRERLKGKLRESGATLLLLEDRPGQGRAGQGQSWKQSGVNGPGGRTERIEVRGESWSGLEHGAGRLRQRTFELHSATTGTHRLLLPAANGRPGFAVDPAPAADAPARVVLADAAAGTAAGAAANPEQASGVSPLRVVTGRRDAAGTSPALVGADSGSRA